MLFGREIEVLDVEEELGDGNHAGAGTAYGVEERAHYCKG